MTDGILLREFMSDPLLTQYRYYIFAVDNLAAYGSDLKVTDLLQHIDD